MNTTEQQNTRIKDYTVKGDDGEDRRASYDPQTTLTVVHDYMPGRSLVFKASEMNAVHTTEIKQELLDLNVAILVDNQELASSSPLKIWNDMRQQQVKV